MADAVSRTRAAPRRCTACEAPVQAADRFCGDCGTPVPKACAQCGAAAASAQQRFCSDCGAAFPGAQARPARPLPATDGASERRLMTVLCCDIVGSSALSRELAAEDVASLLGAYRACCRAAVEKHGGYVARYEGDGVIASFGYPLAMGRDAQSAVACATDILHGVAALSRGARLPRDAAIAVRIGIDTSVIVAGRLGTDGPADGETLVGSARYMAAGLQAAAPPNTVVVGQTTYELAMTDFEFAPLPEERQQRLPPGTMGWLVRQGLPRRHRQRLVLRRRARMFGRSSELAILRERWAMACAGRGQAVMVSGEPGIGKSRIVQELLDHAEAVGPHAVVLLACTPTGSGIALHPLIEALRDAVSGASEDGRSSRAALEAVATAAGVDDRTSLSVLAGTIGLGSDLADMAPPVRRRLLLQSLQTWLLGHPGDRPLLIVAEDLHWSDPSLLDFLRNLIDLLPRRRAMLLVTYRSDFILPWPDRSSTLRLPLAPLDRQEAGQLLDALPGQRTECERERILARSDGVPLFIEEFTLARATPSFPSTLQQLFTARLDALGEARRLSQCAAVLSPHLEPDLLAAVAGMTEAAMREQMSRLVGMEVLCHAAASPREAYAFNHALLQQAAADSILAADRRRLHAACARALAALRPDVAERHPEALADHHAAAGDAAAAWPLYARAARRALATSAIGEAEVLVARGLSVVEHLPPEARAEAALDLQVTRGHVLIARSGYASAAVQDSFEAALAAAGQVTDEARALPPLRGLASFFQVRGPLSKAAAICDRLIAAVEHTGNPSSLADAWRRRGWNRVCSGFLTGGEEDLNRALDALRSGDIRDHIAVAGQDPGVVALANLCWLDVPRRGIRAAAARADATIEAARASPHAVSACYGFVFAAMTLQRAGRWEEARGLAEHALAIADKKGIAYWVALAQVALGHDLSVHRGDPEAGRAAIRRGLDRYRETQGEIIRPHILQLLADAEARLGDVAAAERALAEAVAVADGLGARGFLPELWLRQAMLLRGRPGIDRKALLENACRTARAQDACAIRQAAEQELQADQEPVSGLCPMR